MRSRQLDGDGERTFSLVFQSGEEVASGLVDFAREKRLRAAHFTALGALRGVTLGFWDPDSKDYERIPVREQVEVLVMVGNVALGPDGSPTVHAHLVVGKRDGSAHGGHLLEARVHPTLEVVLTESPKQLQRKVDAETGLALIEL